MFTYQKPPAAAAKVRDSLAPLLQGVSPVLEMTGGFSRANIDRPERRPIHPFDDQDPFEGKTSGDNRE
jgi:hypothetical protein